jgi:hypothetical protein
MPPPTIIFIPTQGLCNRLRAFASANILANFLQATFYVNWIPEPCCNCSLDDLISNHFSSFDLQKISNLKSVLHKPTIHTNYLISEFDKYDYVIIEGGHEFKHPDMDIYTFINKKHEFYNSFEFSNTIQKMLHNCNNIKDCVGVHFRDFVDTYDKQDGRVFNEVSPIQDFISIIKKVYHTNPTTKFFLSSNTNFAYDHIKHIIPNENILYLHNIETNRNNSLGIIHAFLSLILLSKTSFIIGTVMSSFSDEACFFNKISKICIGNEEIKSYHCHGFNTVFEYKMLLPNFQILDRIHK